MITQNRDNKAFLLFIFYSQVCICVFCVCLVARCASFDFTLSSKLVDVAAGAL